MKDRPPTRRTRTRAGAFAVLALLLGATAIAPPHLASAAPVTVTVTTIADTAPGACKTTGTGSCTLREAVIFANMNPGTTIDVPSGTFRLTLTGPDDGGDARYGDLDLRTDVTINGAGAGATIIDGNSSSGSVERVFDIYPGLATPTAITVALNGMTIQKGIADDFFGGGGFWVGLGAAVTLTNSVVADNYSYRGKGGGIAVSGATSRLNVVNSVIKHNNVVQQTKGAQGSGGGIQVQSGTLLVSGSTIENNFVDGAPADFVTSGRPGGDAAGGGVAAGGGANVTIIASTIAGNEVQGGTGTPSSGAEGRGGLASGGGLAATSTDVTWMIVNSTIVSNVATGGDSKATGPNDVGGSATGGGIHVIGVATLLNDTIARNDVRGGSPAGTGTPGLGSGGGLRFVATAGLVANTIIAANRTLGSVIVEEDDVNGSFTSGGHNLIGVRDGGPTLDPSDLSGSQTTPLDPKMASTLGTNGGPTRTNALLSGSPAVGAGDNAICSRPLPPAGFPNGAGSVDQRGTARPQPTGGNCDIGAFEYVYAPSTITLASSANPASVAQAVTFTVNVSAATPTPTPTGTVVIRDGTTSIGGGALAGGVVTVTTAALAEGNHTITASYGGDANFAPSTASINQIVGTPGLQFFPLATPIRLLDTRAGHDAVVAPAAPLVANAPRTLPGHFGTGGNSVPAQALALVGNATVDNTAGVPAGFATLYPNGAGLPLASNLNFVPGTIRPNSFTVGLGADGTFNLLSSTGGDFIVDITGYYAPPADAGLFFHPLAQPVRLLDTRSGGVAVVHPDAALGAGATLQLPGTFTSDGGSIPASAKALAGNATVDNTVGAPAGFATLYPGGALPPTSTLNFGPGTIAPNAFTVGLAADGTFDLYSNTGGDFIVDITGYYDNVPSGGLLFHPLPQPARQLDTRPNHSAAVQPGAPLAAGGTLNLAGAFAFGGVDVPSSAAALVGNATVDNTVNAPAGFATLYPGGAPLPLASNLNYTPGLVAPNAFVVGLGPDHTYNLFSQSGGDFIIDISGFFATG